MPHNSDTTFTASNVPHHLYLYIIHCPCSRHILQQLCTRLRQYSCTVDAAVLLEAGCTTHLVRLPAACSITVLCSSSQKPFDGRMCEFPLLSSRLARAILATHYSTNVGFWGAVLVLKPPEISTSNPLLSAPAEQPAAVSPSCCNGQHPKARLPHRGLVAAHRHTRLTHTHKPMSACSLQQHTCLPVCEDAAVVSLAETIHHRLHHVSVHLLTY